MSCSIGERNLCTHSCTARFAGSGRSLCRHSSLHSWDFLEREVPRVGASSLRSRDLGHMSVAQARRPLPLYTSPGGPPLDRARELCVMLCKPGRAGLAPPRSMSLAAVAEHKSRVRHHSNSHSGVARSEFRQQCTCSTRAAMNLVELEYLSRSRTAWECEIIQQLLHPPPPLRSVHPPDSRPLDAPSARSIPARRPSIRS